MKKKFYIILIIGFMSSFVSVYAMDSFNATYGYIKTVVFHISDYQKVDFLLSLLKKYEET